MTKLGTDEARIKKAIILTINGKAKQAMDDLVSLRIANELVANDSLWITAAAKAHHALHQADEAINVFKNGIARHPESAALNLGAARLMAELQRDEQALEYFHRAEQLAPADSEVLSYFGQFLYFSDDCTGALERFEKIGARAPLNPLFPRMMVCLYNARKYDDCLEGVRSWTSTRSEVDESVFGVGARAAMVLENWPLAKELLERLVEKGGPRHIENLKLLAKVYLRLDDHQEAYTLLSQSISNDSKDEEGLRLLGLICAACGKYSEALQWHSKSIAIAPDSVEARSAFLGTMFGLPEDFRPDPSQMQLHHDNIAILASHPSGVLRPIRVERDDGGFDFENIQREVEKSVKAAREVLEHSSKNPMPLQLLVADLGVQMYEGWCRFTRDSERGVRMCSGTQEEQKTQLEAFEKSRFVSVDLVALFTIHGLGKLGLLSQLFERVYVHISIMDNVVRELREAIAWQDSGRLTSVNGRMMMLPPQPDQRELKIRALTEIRDFLKSGKVILSGLRSTTRLTEFFPEISTNSRAENLMKPALVAHEQKAILLSDDFVFRVLSTRMACPSFCTQALLRRAMGEGLIQVEEYQDAIITLHSWNYHFVSDDKWTLLRLIEKEGLAAADLANKVLVNLTRAGISSGENFRILSELVLYIWAKGQQGHFAAELWITRVFDSVDRADHSVVCTLKLISEVSLKFALQPRMFLILINSICKCRPWGKRRVNEILNHSARLAEDYAKSSSASGDSRLERAWRMQAYAIEFLKVLDK